MILINREIIDKKLFVLPSGDYPALGSFIH